MISGFFSFSFTATGVHILLFASLCISLPFPPHDVPKCVATKFGERSHELVNMTSPPFEECLCECHFIVRAGRGFLTSVGLSSVPSWCKPFEVLSTGERHAGTGGPLLMCKQTALKLSKRSSKLRHTHTHTQFWPVRRPLARAVEYAYGAFNPLHQKSQPQISIARRSGEIQELSAELTDRCRIWIGTALILHLRCNDEQAVPRLVSQWSLTSGPASLTGTLPGCAIMRCVR